jgi:hypothetical protein
MGAVRASEVRHGCVFLCSLVARSAMAVDSERGVWSCCCSREEEVGGWVGDQDEALTGGARPTRALPRRAGHMVSD